MSMNESEGKIFFYLCLGTVLGILGFFRGFKIREKKKMIENIPTSTVRGMAMGLVEVQGVARPFKSTVRAPFSKTEVVFYHYKVEEHRSSGKSSRWVTIAEFSTTDWFYLEDETGKVLVNPAGAEHYLNADRKFSLGSLGSGSEKEAFEKGLVELGIAPHGFMGFDRPLRCTETYICSGDGIYVMGTAANNPLTHLSEIGSENLCIMKEDAFFCISDKSEKDLLGSMAGQMFLFLYGGPVLTVVCLFILIKQYFPSLF